MDHQHERHGRAFVFALGLEDGGDADVQLAEDAGDLRDHAGAILDAEAQVEFRDDLVDRLARAVEAVRHEAEIPPRADCSASAASAMSAMTALDVASCPAPRP